jgi:hypothetical protein
MKSIVFFRHGNMVQGVLILVFCSVGFGAWAKDDNDSWIGTNDFGGTGLIQTRSARSAPDGMLEVGYSKVHPYKRYYLTLQGLPWLEGTFRYTEVTNRLYSPFGSFSGQQTFKDRGADITVRLSEETKHTPALSVTFQDGLGTGQFSGEYLTASKRYYDLDFSAGIAWGYAAAGGSIKNPLTFLSDKFKVRDGIARTGGQFNVGTYFSGEKVGLYGGVAYRTPVKGLVFKAEYDPNNYKNEPQLNVFEKDSAFNFGLYYRPFPWIETSFSIQRGNTGSFRLVMRSNLHSDGMPKFDPPAPELKTRDEAEADLRKGIVTDEPDWPKWLWPTLESSTESKLEARSEQAIAELFEVAGHQGATIESVRIDDGIVQIEVGTTSEGQRFSSAEKIAVLAANIVPEGASRVKVIGHTGNGTEQVEDVEGQAIENINIVNHLFDGLENEGWTLEDMKISHGAAEISISGDTGADVAAVTAMLVMESLPTPVEQIIFRIVAAGQEIKRKSFDRGEITREANLEKLFKRLQVAGFVVEELGFSDNISSLNVRSTSKLTADSFLKYADLFNDVSDTDIDTLVVKTNTGAGKTSRFVISRQEDFSENQQWSVASGSSLTDSSQVVEWTRQEQEYIAEYLSSELSKAKFSVAAVVVEDRSVTVYGSSRAFRQVAKTLGRAFRTMANSIPPEIEELSIVNMGAGIKLNKVTIRRRELEKAINRKGSLEELWSTGEIEGQEPGILFPDNAVVSSDRYPNISWTLNPKIKNHLGGPGQFLLYQFLVTAGVDIGLWRGLNISAKVSRNIYDNFDKIRFGSSSILPHVRSDVREYLQEVNIVAVDRLQANYIFSPMKDWYARASAGIFETMFGGYSGEILFKPHKSRFAVGVDVNKVWQREYDQLFKFREYNVITGHLNTYYEMPWHNVTLGVHTGRYLAGDTGSTLTAVRTFDSGVRFGFWATFTDVPAEVFGEGSFDKGFYITIPFELFLTKSTTRRGTFGFRPITRDGGARVGVRGRLHGLASSGSLKNIAHDWHRFLD